MDTTTKIATQNPAWGFFGTLSGAGVANADDLFDVTARELMTQLNLTADEARLALDAKIGRHMADQLRERENASSLVARLVRQGWTRDIRRAAGRDEDAQKKVLLPVKPEEVPILVFALEHALTSISEAHPEDHARLNALLERLNTATGCS